MFGQFHSPILIRLALVHLLNLDDVGFAEVRLLADDFGLADARHERDGLVVLGEGGGRVVQDRVVVVLLAVAGRKPEGGDRLWFMDGRVKLSLTNSGRRP